MRTNASLRATAAAATLLALGAAALAQTPEQERPRGFRFQTEVLLIPVTVFVTDAEGRPVEDLRVEDFVLKEQGKPREIVFFERIDYEELARSEEARRRPRPLAPGLRRQFLLLFDLSFSTPRGLVRAQEAARRFVEKELTDEDLVAVATWDKLSGLRLLSNFSLDRVPARQMIEQLGLGQATRTVQDRIGFLFDPILEVSTGPGNIPQSFDGLQAQLLETLQSLAVMQERADDNTYRSHATRYLAQFKELNTALRSLSGRKYILLFSEGLDSRFLTGTGLSQMDRDLENFINNRAEAINSEARFGRSELRDVLMEGLEIASAADVVIHTFDVSGLGGDAGDHPGTGAGRGQDTLYIMAEETGGHFFKNLNDFREPLARIVRESASFYLLGFYPRRLERKGRFRKIEVEVRRPGVRVSHRRGYYEPSPPAKLGDVEKRLQIAEYVTKDLVSDDVVFDVLATAFPGQGSLARIPVFVKLPGRQFLASRRDNDVLQLELYGYAVDEKGDFLDFFNKILSFDLGRDRRRLERGGVKYYDLLFAPPGPLRLKLIVRDAETGAIGSYIEDLDVPDFSKDELALTPPLFASTEPDWIVARGFDPARPEPRRQGYPVSYPFEARGEAFIPGIRPTLSRSSPGRFMVRVCNLALHPETGQPQTEMKFERVGPDGETETLRRVALLGRPTTPVPGCFELLFEIRWDDVPDGPALLRMRLTDALRGRTVDAAVPYVLVP